MFQDVITIHPSLLAGSCASSVQGGSSLEIWVILAPLIFFLVLLFAGFWIAFSLGIATLIGFGLIMGGKTGSFPMLVYNSGISFNLLAVPLFMLMANILMEGQISKRLYDGVAPFFKLVPGGLLHTNIAACAVFASICGSGTATSAAIANVAVPELAKRGYDKEITYGSLAAGGPLGTVIPPSIPFIYYGYIAQVSVGKLFIAGIIPGIINALALMAVILILVLRKPSLAPHREKTSLREIGTALPQLAPVVFLILMVLGTIYLGVATPTEAAALGVIGALIVVLIYREASWQRLKNALTTSIRTASVLCFLIIIAYAFSYCLTQLGLSHQVTEALTMLPGPPLMQLMWIYLIYTILGMFLEPGAIIIITTPMVLPFLVSLGWDPLWWGVVLVILCELSCITPPFGLTLFTIQSVTGDTFGSVVRGSIPFYISFFGTMAILTAFPVLVLWLPGKMF